MRVGVNDKGYVGIIFITESSYNAYREIVDTNVGGGVSNNRKRRCKSWDNHNVLGVKAKSERGVVGTRANSRGYCKS